MATLAIATRRAWDQAYAWGEPVYVVERPEALVAMPVETAQAFHIRQLYWQVRGQAPLPTPAPPDIGAEDAPLFGDAIFDTMPAGEVLRRVRDGRAPALVRVAQPDGRVVAIADSSVEVARLVTARHSRGAVRGEA